MQMDIRNVKDFQTNADLVLECLPYVTKLKKTTYDCPVNTEEKELTKKMMKRSDFNFSRWYKLNKLYYALEISAIWVENILNAVFFAPYPCLTTALDVADYHLFQFRGVQESVLNPYPSKNIKKITMVNDIVYFLNIWGDASISGYHCINNGWDGLV